MALRILFVAAEEAEFAGLIRRVACQPLSWPLDFSAVGEYRGVEFLMVANGAGPALAEKAVEVALNLRRPDSIVSTGICGALDPELNIGDVVVADRIIDHDRLCDYPALPVVSNRKFVSGPVLSRNRVATTISDKCSLRETGAIAVEMEAAGVVARASEKGIPFFCVRSVSDQAAEDLVLDFNTYRDREGRISRLRVAGAALRRPWSRIPGLLRLSRNSRAASESLGDFLVDCRF